MPKKHGVFVPYLDMQKKDLEEREAVSEEV